MEDIKWLLRKGGFFFGVLLIAVLVGGLVLEHLDKKQDKVAEEVWEPPVVISSNENELSEQMEKGYDLPVDNKEKEEAEAEGLSIMRIIEDIYVQADKGNASNVTVSDEIIMQMTEKVAEKGYTVTAMRTYFNMRNYKQVEDFLKDSMEGKSGSVVIYEVHSDGGIGRAKYIYDGMDMYVISAKYSWTDENVAVTTYISNTRMKEWRYSDKGWFCYELCVPEYPEVSEMVDGSRLIRVQPMTEEHRELSEKYVFGLGYQGNNLLCSNWDTEKLSILDYNGMYEYLYAMKYQKRFNSEDYPNGIPMDEFESLIMEYLPVTAEQIRQYAVLDEENQTYAWARLGCFTYAPTFFGTSVPEVTSVRKNEDGTITLTVDAVCEMILCDDAVITHELTLRVEEDGSFRYLENKILGNGIKDIPEYQYRFNVD